MKRYENLPHTADLKIRFYGKNKKELFLNALYGMSKNMKPEIINGRVERHIEVSSIDLPALLVDFLSKVLYFSQINKEVYFEIKFLKFSDNNIKAKIFGDKIKGFGEDIKAVTYHNLIIEEKNGIWQTEVLFDI